MKAAQLRDAILACRIIDRPLRPLFPHTLRNEVQVVQTVLAVNPDDAYDVFALNAASASTMIWSALEGPVSGVFLALIDGQWVLPALERARDAPCSRSWSLAAYRER